MLLGLLSAAVVPFIPMGRSSLYEWMSQYTMDTVGGARTGYVMTFLLCWILCVLPMLVWTLIANRVPPNS